MRKLRVLGYVVQVQFVVDDGDTLDPLPVQPVTVSPADWPDVVAKVAEATDALAAQIAASEPNRAARRAKPKP